MKKKNKDQQGVKMTLPGWMASYADMFTVMMVFFILLFAMSQIDQELFDRFMDSFNRNRIVDDPGPISGFGDTLMDRGPDIMPDPLPPLEEGIDGDPDSPGGLDPAGDTVGDMMNTFATYMADIQPGFDGSGGFTFEQKENYIQISINNEIEGRDVFFPSGQARLTSYAITTLNTLGPILLDFTQKGHGVVVEGHTDNQPINNATFPSNWTLSAVRASSVVEHLVSAHGIDVRMIAGLGRGEYFPVGDNSTAEGRAQNRRVEIKVFTQEATTGGAVGGWFVIPGTV
ncbi:MAG: flagellar motor protein MotB [Defluviitaleaceae bacterium]|nr:flagellar motor protein MotB [Defluviitaleaceae bacterium]